MYVLSCKELGFDHCEFVATGESAQRVADAMFAHARDEHPYFISGLTSDERAEIRLAMDEAIARRWCHERAQQCAQ